MVVGACRLLHQIGTLTAVKHATNVLISYPTHVFVPKNRKTIDHQNIIEKKKVKIIVIKRNHKKNIPMITIKSAFSSNTNNDNM